MDVDVDSSSAVNRVNTTTESNDVSPVSATKVQGIPQMTSENISGYRLVDMEILFNVFKELVCPSCYIENLLLEENTDIKKGLSAELVLKCSCGYEKDFYTWTRTYLK